MRQRDCGGPIACDQARCGDRLGCSRGNLLARFFKRFLNPLRIFSAIETPNDDGFSRYDFIIDRIGKSFCEQAMIAKLHMMNSTKKHQGVNFGKQAIKEVIAHAALLPIIKLSPGGKIVKGLS